MTARSPTRIRRDARPRTGKDATTPIEPRKTPRQERARVTVDAIVEAAARILRSDGMHGLNTNRVAEQAGVSIGSLYQYFPNKQTLIAELRRQHFAAVRAEMGAALQAAASLPLEAATRLLIEASIRAHGIDPQLHRIIDTQGPQLELSEDDGSQHSARRAIEQLLLAHRANLRPGLDIALAARISYRLVESLTHSAVIDDPALLAHPHFVDELTRVLLRYVSDA